MFDPRIYSVRAHRASYRNLARDDSESLHPGRRGYASALLDSPVLACVGHFPWLAQIADGVAGISDRNVQIATAAEEQSAVAEDINRNVVEINDVAIQVSAGAEQTATTSLELARLADRQQQLVGRFKVA